MYTCMYVCMYISLYVYEQRDERYFFTVNFHVVYIVTKVYMCMCHVFESLNVWIICSACIVNVLLRVNVRGRVCMGVVVVVYMRTCTGMCAL